MNSYALAFVLGLLVFCPASPALAAQSLSEKDTAQAEAKRKPLAEAAKPGAFTATTWAALSTEEKKTLNNRLELKLSTGWGEKLSEQERALVADMFKTTMNEAETAKMAEAYKQLCGGIEEERRKFYAKDGLRDGKTLRDTLSVYLGLIRGYREIAELLPPEALRAIAKELETLRALETFIVRNEGKYAEEEAAFVRKAAEQGDAKAQCELGWMYKNGQGSIAQDEEQAVAWWRKAADQGYAEAQYALGAIYSSSYNDKVAKDTKQAVAWLRKAAEQGHAGAKAALKRAEQEEQAEGQAASVRKAAEQGDAKAQYELGLMYYNTRKADDKAQAEAWFRKAADQGYAEAQYALGRIYAARKGAANKEQAVALLRKAADQGNAKAQYALGEMYRTKDGVAQDMEQAAAWYRKAADQGHAGAQYWLGWQYNYGYGVAKDEAQAVAWYRKAAEQGNSHAKDALRRFGK